MSNRQSLTPLGPNTQEPSFVGNTGNSGNSGNSQCFLGFQAFPLMEVLGNRGNTHLFFNIRARTFHAIWLFPFPLKNKGEHVPHLEAPYSGAVTTVPPFPSFLKSQEHWITSNTGKVAQ